jgi:hypothetical protein
LESLRKIAGFIRDPNVAIDTSAFVFALIVSLVVSTMLAYLYRFFYEDRATGSQVHRSFVLLGPSVTALFIAIQFSLPLSLGLLGALSIVRFRTPIKEPEEVGFIMLLVACSVVIATFQLLLLAALLATVTVGLLFKHYFPAAVGSTRKDGTILLTLSDGADDTISKVSSIVNGLVSKGKLESVSQLDGTTTLHFSFCDLTQQALDSLHTKLSAGGYVSSVNMYFNRSSSLI